MPVRIPDTLPAARILTNENIFVMTEKRAMSQDIRPLKIAILNLMPTKIVTETQILRLIGNTPIQVDITLLHMRTHTSKNTPADHLDAFYRTFGELNGKRFDGLIITGAPVETMEFEDVNYWDELTGIMDWAKHHVFSTLFICWAAQAALYYHYGIQKRMLDKKMFGVFRHNVLKENCKLLRGFDDVFYAPHSRHAGTDTRDIINCKELELLAESDEAGVYLAQSHDGRQVYVTGHSEYDYDTLDTEYRRDVGKGLPINVPKNYYLNDDPQKKPEVRWRAHSNLLFSNWLNYYVYQETPYDIDKIN